ncbi:hypothetical protein J3R83DRAFT_1563 [Lanmaoa asiatica]|nr:hypothetical protein J3R83DRAFT_1563 [Lanmaoa asiatica]
MPRLSTYVSPSSFILLLLTQVNSVRVEFTREHDNYLFKYLATYCPTKEGRSGNKIYKELVENKPNLWPWSVHHTWQSWRTRYCKNSAHFDALISKYQRKPNNKHKEGRKRAIEPMPVDILEPSAKRVKLVAEERVAASETRTEQGATAQHASSRPSTSKLTPERPREPQEAPSMIHPPREPEPTDVRPPSPPLSSTNTNTDTSENPTLDLPAIQTRHDTPEIPPLSPDKPAPPPMDGKPESRTPSRAVKRLKERPRTPSEVFASEPSSPRRDPAVVDPVVGARVTDTVYPRAPPRVVDSFHGQVLVDRKGDVPRVLPHEMKDKAEEGGEKEEEVRWPPVRGRTAEPKRVSGPHVEVAAHHAFSQSRPQSGPEAPQESVEVGEREQGKAHHPFGHIPPALDRALLDRRTVVGRFAAGVCRDVAPLVESEQGGDAVQNEASPVKRVVPPASAAPLPDPPSGASKFPAPRASTRSPFRPEPPARETPHSPPRLQSRAKAMHHPALARLRRQTIGHRHGNGNGHERERGQVPSIDLVALSRSSMSSRSHSDSSAGASAPARPPRWSLPAFAHATPWVFNEPGGAPSAPGSVVGSGSGSPFRWVAPSPVYSDIWAHRHARTSSLVGTSTPQFTTPSPARSITAVATNTIATANTSVPRPDAISTSTTHPLAPHPADVPLAASHGLASILAYMSANHGLALGVVEAVYARVGGLREADEVLKGMREAAEGFGEKEIKRRLRGRREEHQGGLGSEARGEEERGNGNGNGKERERTRLQYVITSEDGEGSEYSPPETSRAAMWKRQSESVSHTGEGGEEEGEGGREDRDDGDEAEGRAIEQELRKGEGENSDEDGLSNILHDFSKHLQEALLENTKAQELERKLGKGLYRRHIVMQFI